MEKKKTSWLLVGVLIGFVFALLMGVCLFFSKTISFNSSIHGDSKQTVDNNKTDVNEINEKQESITYENYEEKTEDGAIIKYTFEKNSNYVSKVNVEDTYAFNVTPETGVDYFILREGKVYYYHKSCQNDGYCSYAHEKNDFKEYNLAKIIRIKSGNFFSTGFDFSVILITEDGRLIKGYLDRGTNGFNFEEFDQSDVLSKYKVDDVLEYNFGAGPGMPSWKVVLHDGTIFTKNVIN